MEFSDYIAILKKNILLMLALGIVLGLVAFFATSKQPTSYQATSALEILRDQTQKQSDVAYYQYDNYYNVQVSANLSDNLVGWLAAPSTVAEIFRGAGYDVPSGDLRDLGKIFTVKKKISTSSVIDVSYVSTDSDKAESLMKAAMTNLKGKVEQYNKSDNSSKFSVSISEPVVIIAPKQLTINTVVAVIVGLLIGTGIAFARESTKK